MLARKTRDASQARRLLALAEVYDGGSRGKAARIGGVGRQTVRDWVLRFNTDGATGLVDGKAPGQTPKLNDAERQTLRQIVEDGPIPAVHGVVRWRLVDLAQWVWEEFRVSISKQTLSGSCARCPQGAARDGLPQAVGPAAASRQGRGGRHGI